MRDKRKLKEINAKIRNAINNKKIYELKLSFL
jgi:hypothetical protein